MNASHKPCPRCNTSAPLDSAFCHACGYQYRKEFVLPIDQTQSVGPPPLQPFPQDTKPIPARTNQGYIYVLANSSIPDLVKVGKSSRSASERAQELSRASGVPTPFIVVYEQLFEDCDAAEKLIHAVLTRIGMRQSDSREFFRASSKDVIDVILATPGKSSDASVLGEGQDDLESLVTSFPWSGIFQEAENSNYGSNGAIQDREEAMILYLEAAKLGCPLASERIGSMYRHAPESQDFFNSKALDWYKTGVRAGNYYCYICMAGIFQENGHQENHQKAFNLYIRSRADKLSPIIEKDQPIECALGEFITGCFRLGCSPFPESIQDMTIFKGEILHYLGVLLRHDQGRTASDQRTWMLETVNSAIHWVTESL